MEEHMRLVDDVLVIIVDENGNEKGVNVTNIQKVDYGYAISDLKGTKIHENVTIKFLTSYDDLDPKGKDFYYKGVLMKSVIKFYRFYNWCKIFLSSGEIIVANKKDIKIKERLSYMSPLKVNIIDKYYIKHSPLLEKIKLINHYEGLIQSSLFKELN